MIMAFLNYSTIDENENAKTIQKVSNSETKYLYFKSKIDGNIIRSISHKNINLNDEFYEQKTNTPSVNIYCGPTTRVKMKFKNKKIVTFFYNDTRNNSKYSLFIQLQNILTKNYLSKNYDEIKRFGELESQQRDFEKYTINKDTITLKFPSMPTKNDMIKFVK